MAPATHVRLENVAFLDVYARIGAPGTEGTVKHLTVSEVRDGIRCSNPACKKGVFDLRTDVADKFVSKMRTEGQSLVPCKGFSETGGQRSACPFLMAYALKVVYTR